MGSLVEVDVMAATREGNGPPASARVTLTATIPAAIYSLGGPLRAHKGDDVSLPCGHVGDPKPHLEWKHREMSIKTSAQRRIQLNGALELQGVEREDSGNYTCTVSNPHGADHVTYLLSVFGKEILKMQFVCNLLGDLQTTKLVCHLIAVPPEPPLILVSSSTSDSILVQWKKVDDGGAPITGFILNYRKDNEPWSQITVHRHTYSYVLKVCIRFKRDSL